MLRLENLEVFYGDMMALNGISLEVDKGEIVSIIGSNGAGKSTAIKTISGILQPRKGLITWNEGSIVQLSPSRRVQLGIIQIPEGRQLFSSMSVMENLEMGALNPRARLLKAKNLISIFQLFPRLAERKSQLAGTLSGGEQQMLAIGRGLMSVPEILMLDEPSLGLAPLFVTLIFKTIAQINRGGTTILLVEQNINYSLKISRRTYVLENGDIVVQGLSEDLLKREDIRQAYLGL